MRREQVRQAIGVVDKGLRPLSPGEFEKQLARQTVQERREP
ncbi:MAG TPA: hypothetical protein VMW47_03500 [Verrucomicrobiae bacterium]|nr:hypothetical protein [Verrucomicrobiae bacterium]